MLKQTIADLNTAVRSPREKLTGAKEEYKRLEKDMDEFEYNKEGVIEELKVRFFLPFLALF